VAGGLAGIGTPGSPVARALAMWRRSTFWMRVQEMVVGSQKWWSSEFPIAVIVCSWC
jgi:hypothetical protein